MDTRLPLQSIFVTALAVVATPAAASPEATLILEASPRQAVPGSIIEVSTKIATSNDIGAFQFTVEYDDQIMSFVDATLGADLVGTSFWISNVVEDIVAVTEPGTNRSVLVQVVGSAVQGFSGPDTEVTLLRFRLTANEGTSPLVFNTSACQPTHMATLDLRTLCPDALAFQGEQITSGSGSPPPGGAEATLILEATPSQAESGSLIEVATKITTDTQIGAFQYTVEYDDRIMTYVDATLGPDLVGSGFVITNINDGGVAVTRPGTTRSLLVQVFGGGVEAFTGSDRDVVRLRFRLTANEGTSPLVFNTSSCPPTHMTRYGLFTTMCPDDMAFEETEVTNGGGSPPPVDPQASIVWRDAARAKTSLWLMDATTVLPQSGLLPRINRDWIVAGTGDFNGDGHTDLLWRHRVDGRNRLWLLDETTLLPASGALPTVANRRWVVAGAADFNGDGTTDILWRHTRQGKNSVWLLDGTTVLPGSGPLPALSDLDWIVAGAGDFDGDGRADVLWRHLGNGSNAMWLLDGPTVRPGSGAVKTIANQRWQVAAIGDFDADGRADILWRHRRNGRNSVWFMAGRTVGTGSGALPVVDEAGWIIAGAADFDGDGNADVLWRNLETGRNLIWFMDGTRAMPFASRTNTVKPIWTAVGVDD